VEIIRLLFDTSAYSAFMRGHERIRCAVRANEEIFLDSIVIGELTAGFIKDSRRKKMRRNCADFSRLRALDSWMSPKKRLNDTQSSSWLWQASTPIPTHDVWIAATAMEYALSVVTTDDHYQKIPQIMVDCFAAV
jgi:predicted nucleic acid-binding protein